LKKSTVNQQAIKLNDSTADNTRQHKTASRFLPDYSKSLYLLGFSRYEPLQNNTNHHPTKNIIDNLKKLVNANNSY